MSALVQFEQQLYEIIKSKSQQKFEIKRVTFDHSQYDVSNQPIPFVNICLALNRKEVDKQILLQNFYIFIFLFTNLVTSLALEGMKFIKQVPLGETKWPF